MKKKIYFSLFIASLMMSPLFTMGQMMGPEDPGGDPIGEDPIGGGAPVGNGIGILLALGAAYGGKKLYTLFNDQKESLEE